MATIGDVAREAGVSRSTASTALSGKRKYTPETMERISAAAARLGFTVNARARALATSETKVLGLAMQFNEDEYPPATLQYIRAISRAARVRDRDVLIIADDDGPSAITRVTASHLVDGVVLLDVLHDDPRTDAVHASNRPGALIGQPNERHGVAAFEIDYSDAALRIVDHLAALGHKDVVLFSPPKRVFERGGAYAWRRPQTQSSRRGWG